MVALTSVAQRRAPRRETFDRSRYERSRMADVADVRLSAAGNLEKELGPEMEKQVRLLIVDGYLNDRDLRYIKKLCDRSRVYGADGREVDNYIDIDMSHARINNGGSFFTSGNRDVLSSSMFSNCNHLRSIVLPDRLRKIDRGAFRYCSNLEDVVLPYGLDEIGEEAFMNCSQLIHIYLPDGLRTVGNKAFSGCTRIRSFYIPETVERIGDYAFEKTAISDVYLPDRLEYLGAGALSGTNIRSLYIPRDTKIGNDNLGTLSRCNEIQIDPSNRYYTMVGTALYDRSITKLLSVLSNTSGPLSVEPGTRVITAYACSGCGITSVDLPDGLEEIGDGAFKDCSKLCNVNIPESCTKFGASAFRGTALTSVELPEGTQTVPYAMFQGCSRLTSVELSNSILTIGEDAFRDCSALTSIEIPGSVTKIYKSAFESCSSLCNLTLNDGLATISEYAFKKCRLLNMTLPMTVKEVGKNAFNNCGMASITLNDGLSIIGDNAFSDNNLIELTIPASVVSIGKKITEKNKNMARIVCKGRIPAKLEKVTNDKVQLVVPSGTAEVYKAQDNWKKFKNIAEE